MYPPPHSDVYAEFAGATVELVSFGQYVIHLSFDNGDMISIASSFRFDSVDLFGASPLQEFPVDSSNLPRILGISVRAASAESDGTLRLDFANGDALVVYAYEPAYEVYTLLVNGKEYVV